MRYLVGVDSLANLATQKGLIFERIRERQHTGQQRTRAELKPLLYAARLQAVAGQATAARATYEELLKTDPSWPELLEEYAHFLENA